MREFLFFLYDRQSEVIQQTLQHLSLTFTALVFAILAGLGLGILMSRFPRWAGLGLSVLGVIQTIPSLALLGFMLPLVGIGFFPAIVALFLYALLPIARNTYTGIEQVERSIKEAATGMGMTNQQQLWRLELPLAAPIIFAGIRTAAVVNVGVATLCALIAAGGLGELIFRGIALNDSNMILAGAVPAALLALILDGILGVVQKYIHKIFKLVTLVFILLTLGIGFNQIKGIFIIQQKILAGFDAEFTARADGLPALLKHYHLPQFKTVELDAGLMYQALHKGRVDIIGGYSTDGRIEVFDLFILEDDQKFFPPYYAAPLVRNQSLEKYPELRDVFKNIEGKMTDSVMRALNYQVDELKKNPKEVAQIFLKSMGLKHALIERNNPSSMITIGGKKFTEHYILAEIFKQLIENYSKLSVSLKTGLGGTQIAFEALKKGEIDLYPEYTGTALYVILKDEKNIPLANIKNPDSLYHYVQLQSQKRFDMTWLGPLGFNNTYALMMTKEKAKRLNIQKISDLKYLQNF